MLIYMTVPLILGNLVPRVLHFSNKAVVEEKTLGTRTSLTLERFSSRAPDVSLVQKISRGQGNHYRAIIIGLSRKLN